MEPHPSPECLILLTEGHLAEGEARLTIRHVESCDSCKAAYAELLTNLKLVADLRDAIQEPHPVDGVSCETARVPPDAGSSDTRSQSLLLPDTGLGTSVSGYELLRSIAKGGFGEVCLAREILTGALCAIKFVQRDRLGQTELEGIKAYKQRLRNHPRLVSVGHVGRTEHSYYYIMELADDARGSGPHSLEDYEPMTLKEHLARGGPLDVRAAVSLCCHLLDGLQDLHLAGLLHRDIKPANILRFNGEWKLGDMGLVSIHSQIKDLARTPRYAPPEGVVNSAGDLYSLGIVLCEMISGTHPGTPCQPCEIPEAMEPDLYHRVVDVVARACDSEPSRRFRTATEMRDALQPRRKKRTTLLILLGLLVLLLSAGIGFWMIASRNGQAAPSQTTTTVTQLPILEVYYRVPRSANDDSYYMLDEHHVPLITGTLIQVRVRLASPGYPYLFHLTEGASPHLLYPASGRPAEKVVSFESPRLSDDPNQQVWHTLSPPAGTEMLLLLVADDAVGDVAPLATELAQFRLPKLDPAVILVGDASQPVLRWNPTRGIEPNSTVAPRGPLENLGGGWQSRFRCARLLAFPHVDTRVPKAGG